MAQELAVKSYYQSLVDSNFVSTNICCRIGLEFFLSTLLFRADIKRVIYSKDDIAFRRRIETLGNGDVKLDQFNYVQLDLPFAAYSQTGPYEEDDRGSTQNAGQIVLGQIQPDTGIIVKAAAVKVKYNATVFFARRDDVNIASQLLYWEKTPKFPIYYIVQHTLAGFPIDIPVFMTLESFDSNVDYNEKDWLLKSKIFPIKLEFTIRSYQTLIEHIDDTIKLPIRFSGLYGYNDEEIIFAQNTAMIWSDQKWTPEELERLNNKSEYDQLMEKTIVTDKSGIVTMGKKEGIQKIDGENKIVYENAAYPSPAVQARAQDQQLIDYGKLQQKQVDDTIEDAIAGYFADDSDCVLDEFHQKDDTTTDTTIDIEWKVKEADLKHYKNITVYVPGLVRDQIDDPHITTFTIEGLHPGSKYDCTLIVTSKSFTKLTYKLKLKTKGEPVLGKKLSDKLVGKTWTFSSRSN
jgi:hypothetical protein